MVGGQVAGGQVVGDPDSGRASGGRHNQQVGKWQTTSYMVRGSQVVGVTLGLSHNRSAWRIKGNQATFDNSQWNNLRSCMWVSVVVFRSVSPLSRREGSRYIGVRLGETW